MSKILILTGFAQSTSANKSASAFRIIRGTRKYEYLQVVEGLRDPLATELETIYSAIKYLMEEIKTEINNKIVVCSEEVECIRLLRKISRTVREKKDSTLNEIVEDPGKLETIKNIFSLQSSPGQFKFKFISNEIEEKPNDEVVSLALKGATEMVGSYEKVSCSRKRSPNEKRIKRKKVRKKIIRKRKKKGQTRKPTPHGVRR